MIQMQCILEAADNSGAKRVMCIKVLGGSHHMVAKLGERRRKLSQSLYNKREKLKSKIYDKNIPLEERFALVMTLAQLPRSSATTRIRNRCELTGRPRGVIRKFGISRNKLRELSGRGLIPGVIKSSW